MPNQITPESAIKHAIESIQKNIDVVAKAVAKTDNTQLKVELMNLQIVLNRIKAMTKE